MSSLKPRRGNRAKVDKKSQKKKKKERKNTNSTYIVFNTICISEKMIIYEKLLKYKSYSSKLMLSSK